MSEKVYLISLTLIVIFISTFQQVKKVGALLAPDYDFPTAVASADLIVQGRVIETSAEWVEGPFGRNIFTHVRIRVDFTIKGDPGNEEIEFRVMGGTIGNITQIVSDLATFVPEEEVIVLLSSQQDALGTLDVLPGYGKIPIQKGSVSWAGSSIARNTFIEALNAFIKDPDSNLDNLLESSIVHREALDYSDTMEEEAIGQDHINTNQIDIPDLRPYKPPDWDNTIVISNETGTNESSNTIFDNETIYVDFACINHGKGHAGHFRFGLYIDGTLVESGYRNSLKPGYYTYLPDGHAGVLSAGEHTFKVICDYENEVFESNEKNNEYRRKFTITEWHQDGPEISSISPVKGSAGTGTEVTVLGDGFGATPGSNGKVEFWYGRNHINDPDRIEATIVSWSDSKIVCEVPVARLNGYPASACSGPLRVISNAGELSNEVLFLVTFSYRGIKWPDQFGDPVVPYRINENTFDCTGEGSAVRAGAKMWNNTRAAFSFAYAGKHNNTDVGENGNNDIMWGHNPKWAFVARASAFFKRSLIYEADIVFNDYYQWSSGNNPGSNEYDIQSVAAHEFGHWLFLQDLYGDIGDGVNDVSKVMCGRGNPGEMKRNLHNDDVAGIRWIYGTSIPQAMPWLPLLLFEE